MTLKGLEGFISSKRYVTRSEIAEYLEVEDCRDLAVVLWTLDFVPFSAKGFKSVYWAERGERFVDIFDKSVSNLIPGLASTVLETALKTYATKELLDALLAKSKKFSLSGGKYVVRNVAKTRDLVYLILLDAGSPKHIEDLANVETPSDRALIAQLSRDTRFYRDVTSGEWGITDWTSTNGENSFKNAYEAIDFVLSNFGPQTSINLYRLAAQHYPRSYARYQQVFEDEKYGLTAEGLWDFTSNGAVQKEPKEPKTTPLVQEVGNRYAKTSLKVDAELLRGSGVQVNRRLTWVMGLTKPTRSLTFTVDNLPGRVVTVYRSPGAHHVSALKVFADEFGLHAGCVIDLAFDIDTKRAGVRPGCLCHSNIT